jgi:hypothetical protein
LPHRLGAAPGRVVAAGLLLAASVVLAVGPPGQLSAFGLVVLVLAAGTLLAGLLLGRRPGSRAAFRSILIVALLDVLALVAAGVHVG